MQQPTDIPDDELPDARVASRGTADRDMATVRIAGTKGFDAVPRRATEVTPVPKAAAKTIDGVPLWVVIPLAVLAGLLGVVLLGAAIFIGMRVWRR